MSDIETSDYEIFPTCLLLTWTMLKLFVLLTELFGIRKLIEPLSYCLGWHCVWLPCPDISTHNTHNTSATHSISTQYTCYSQYFYTIHLLLTVFLHNTHNTPDTHSISIQFTCYSQHFYTIHLLLIAFLTIHTIHFLRTAFVHNLYIMGLIL